MSARLNMVPKPFVPEDLNWHACYDLSHPVNAGVYSNNANMDYLYDSSGNGNDALRAETANDEITYLTSGDVNSKPCFRQQKSGVKGDSFIGRGFELSLAVDIVSYSIVIILDIPTLFDTSVAGFLWSNMRDNTGGSGGTGTYTERARIFTGTVDPADFRHVDEYANDDLVTPNHAIQEKQNGDYAVGTYGMVWRLIDTDVTASHNGTAYMTETDRVVDSTQAWDTSATWGILTYINAQNHWPCDVAFFGIYNGDIEADPKWGQFQTYISNEYGVTI